MARFGLSEELREYVRAWMVLKGTDMFIVPGTGLVTDAFGLSGWGPYGLLKWLLIARLRRCKVLVVSVGAGPIDGAIARRLVKVALSLAHYRSYRDLASKLAVEGAGVRTARDRIFPDLVFGLSLAAAPCLPDRPKPRPVVALGLMEYVEKYSGAGPTQETYVRYLESLAIFVRWLLDRNYDVKLLLGDEDTQAIEDFTTALQMYAGSYDETRVAYQQTESVQELLSQISAADFVVATRFHNVLMSLLLHKPVIAISFHHKCSSLMAEMSLSDYCQNIHEMDAHVLIAQFQALTQNASDITGATAERIEEARKALDEQYELLFETADQPSSLHAFISTT